MGSLSIAFSLFLILNSVGAVPTVCEMLKGYSVKKQRKIILKDMLAVLILLLIFGFFGGMFFDWLHINDANIRMAGGLILLLIAIKLIFPAIKKYDIECPMDEPFIVPIATPLVAGPTALAAVMVFARQEESWKTMLGAIVIAWFFTALILYFSHTIKRVVGEKGIVAFQRLMGLILTLIAVQMFLQGLTEFITANFGTGA